MNLNFYKILFYNKYCPLYGFKNYMKLKIQLYNIKYFI